MTHKIIIDGADADVLRKSDGSLAEIDRGIVDVAFADEAASNECKETIDSGNASGANHVEARLKLIFHFSHLFWQPQTFSNITFMIEVDPIIWISTFVSVFAIRH